MDRGISPNTFFNERIEALARWMMEARQLVMFTGAGISTESGLADFRGPEGVWTRRAKGLPVEQGDFGAAEPNTAHMAIVELQRLGKLSFLISQNVDNLHLKSGIVPDLLAELHGNIMRLRCRRCEFEMDNFDDVVSCPLCEAEMRSSVVDFGQSLPQQPLAEAYTHSQKSDLFIVAGSTLMVAPASDMPAVAVRSGARLVIINQGETPLDHLAGLRFEERISEVLPRAVARLKTLML